MRYLKIAQAAQKLNVSTKTLRRWEENGILVPKRTPGGQRVYLTSVIESFVRPLAAQEDNQETTETKISAKNLDNSSGVDVLPVAKNSLKTWTKFGVPTAVFLLIFISAFIVGNYRIDQGRKDAHVLGAQTSFNPFSAFFSNILRYESDLLSNSIKNIQTAVVEALVSKVTINVNQVVVEKSKVENETLTNTQEDSVGNQGVGVNSVENENIANNQITAQKLNSSLIFSANQLIDLSKVNHSTISKQGLILPNTSSSSPSLPSSGEGYLAYDTNGNQLIIYNGSSWQTVGGDGNSGGDITDINAGEGLTGGGGSGDITLNIVGGSGFLVSADQIDLDVTTSGTTSSTSSNSGLDIQSDGLSLLRGCSNGQILKWNGVTEVWYCSSDSGGGGGSMDIQEGGGVVVSGADAVNFTASDFSVTDSPSGTGLISIDYVNSKISRYDSSETLTNKTISAGSNTISGLTNSNLSGSAGITNANLANSSITINSAGILSGGASVSLGGNITLTATEADTLATVTGRGASTSTAVTLSSASPLTFSNSAPAITLGAGNSNATFTVKDTAGSPNTLLTLTDAGSVGNLSISGTIAATGALSGSNFSGSSSGTNTGDQTITLTGDVTGSGTGSFATTIAANSVALTTDTTGNYVANGSSGNGVSLTGGGSEGATLTAALGALTEDWGQTGAFDVVLNNTSSELKILESGSTPTLFGIFDVGDLSSADSTFTFSGGSGTVLTSANVASALSGWDQDSSNDLTTGNYSSTLDAVYVNVAESPSASDIAGSFSSGLTINANTIDDTELTDTLSYTGALSVGNLTISDTGVPLTGASFAFDFNNVSDRTLTIANSGSGTANFSVDGTISSSNFSGSSSGTNTGDQTITLTGDVTGSGTGSFATTIAANSVALTTDTTGNYVSDVTSGNNAISIGNSAGEGWSPSISLSLQSTSNGLSSTVSNGSGLEITTGGLTLLQGCSDNQIIKWDETNDVWECAADEAGGGAGNSFETVSVPAGSSPVADSSTDTLSLSVTGTNLTITGNSAADSIDFDIDESVLAGSGLVANSSALDIGAGNGISVAADSVAVDQSFGFTFTGNNSFSPSSTNDFAINTDADSTFVQSFSSATNNTSSNTISLTNSASSGTISVRGLDFTFVGTDNASGANTITGINFGNATSHTNNTYNGLTFGTGYTNFLTSGTINIAAGGTITGATLAAGDNTITGLTNSNLSGSAGITNANLANSSVTINSSGILTGGGLVSLGGTLSLTATEADTLADVVGRGATTSTALTLSNSSNSITAGTLTATGGSIDGVAIGASTPSTGAFTTLSATGDVTLNDAGADNILIGSTSDTLTLTSNTLSITDDNWSVSSGGAAAFASVTEGGTSLASKYAPIAANFITVTSNGTLTGETGIDALTTAVSTTSTLNVDSTSTLNTTTIDANANLSLADGAGTYVQTFSPLGTTGAPKGFTVTPKFTLDATDQTLTAIYVNANTNSNNDSGDTLYALNLEDIVGSSAIESALRFGSGWDNIIDNNGTLITATELNIVDGGIANSELTDSGTLTAGTVDINGGSVDGVTIGGSVSGAATFTALTSTGSVDLSSDTGADTITIGQNGTTDDTVTIAGAISLTDDQWSVTDAGLASFITGSSVGSITFTTNNIADSGALTIKSATTNALTLDSGTTGTVNLGTSNNAKTIAIGTGNAGNILNIATDNTVSDTISIGSALDNISITGDEWSITDAGVLTVASCSGCGGGGSALDTLTAATGDDTALLSADNTIEWNWALTSATSKGITLGESAASTNGSGDQHILRLDTASGSTAGPLEVVSNSADSADIEFNLNSSGDFEVQDAGTAFATFSDDGTITLGKSAATSAINIGVGTGADTINIGTGATTADTLTFGNVGVATTFTFNSGATTQTPLTYDFDTLTQGTGIDLSLDGLTTGTGLKIDDNTGAGLTTGSLLYVNSVSTALTSPTNGGSLAYFNWSPASTTNATGDLFRINIGSSGNTSGNIFNITDNGTTNFAVSETQITSGIPHSFTAVGDVAIAYDLVFTNQTSSLIDSYGPLTIRSGESFENNNLTLTTYGTGAIIADGKFSVDSQIALDDSTTPSVSSGNYFIENNSTNRLVTNFTNGTAGQVIYIEIGTAANFDLDCTSSNIVCGTADITAMATGDTISLIYDGTNWNLLTWTDVSVSNADNTDGVDIAEYFPSMQNLSAGEVVKIDINNPEHVVRSASAYENKVVGIVSTTPGITLGQNNGSAYAIALAGRVPVKISALSEDISPGDYITTSPESGKAMKAAGNGRVIGQALESWNSSSGKSEIVVFINNSWFENAPSIAADGSLNIDLSVENIKTNKIKPIVGRSDVNIQIGSDSSPSGRLKIENIFGDILFEVNSVGDATISGDLYTVGDLYATNIHSQNIEDIEALLEQVQADQALLASNSGIFGATSSASLSELVTSDLYVTNQAAMYSLSVSSNLTIGDDLVIQSGDSSVNTLTTPLKLQSLGLAPVEIMAGHFKIGTNGNVEIVGDLKILGSVEAKKFVVSEETAGKAVILSGETEIVIQNPNISASSLIFITPTSPSSNGIYVKSQASGQATVGFVIAEDFDVTFNWWIVGTTVQQPPVSTQSAQP